MNADERGRAAGAAGIIQLIALHDDEAEIAELDAHGIGGISLVGVFDLVVFDGGLLPVEGGDEHPNAELSIGDLVFGEGGFTGDEVHGGELGGAGVDLGAIDEVILGNKPLEDGGAETEAGEIAIVATDQTVAPQSVPTTA